MKKCMCCMRDYSESGGACPICGYSEEQMRIDAENNAEALKPETILKGRFILGRVLDMSDFSIIYIAWDALLSRRVVIREYFPLGISERDRGSGEIRSGSAQDQLKFEKGCDMFEEENKILSRSQDIPELINVYRTFREKGTIYSVSQYIEGYTLQDYLDMKGGDLSQEKRLALFRRIVDIIGTLHERGIVHLNLAPENIYMDDDGKLTIIDFGAAKRAVYELRDEDLRIFDDRYSAPEVLLGGQIGPAADMYSLGTIYYQMVTGKYPPKSISRVKKHAGLKVSDAAAAPVIDLLTNPDLTARPGSVSQLKKAVGWR